MGLFRKQTEARIRKSQRPSIVAYVYMFAYVYMARHCVMTFENFQPSARREAELHANPMNE
jgi:hypothetical protein